MKARTVTVAAIQMNSGANPEQNLESAVALVEYAADEGATYVQVPEYFNYLGPSRRFTEVAESIPGPTTARMAAVATSRSCTSIRLRASCSLSCFWNCNGVIEVTARKCS